MVIYMKFKIKPSFREKIAKDRFTIGLVSGLFAGIAMTLLNYIFIYTSPAKTLYADFVGIMLLGSKPSSFGEITIATISHIFLGGILGVIFSFLLIYISTHNLIIKGISYGTVVFLFLFSLGVIFKIPYLAKTSIITVISKGVGSALYGLVLAYTILFLNKDTNKL